MSRRAATDAPRAVEPIAPAALDAVTGGDGCSLSELRSSPEGLRLLAQYLPGRRPRPPVR